MTTAQDAVVPKYEQLRKALTAMLDDLLPHDALPSERELMARFSVSRATVRQAMARLIDDGLVYQVRGSGTFVADPATVVKSLRLTSFSEDIRARRMTPGSKLLAFETERAGAEVAEALVLRPGDPVVHIERLRTADGAPMCLENVWLPQSLLPDLTSSGLSDSLYERLAEMGVEPRWADQHIRATVLDPREAELLDVAPFSAALVVARVTFDQRDRPIERARGIYRADRYDFRLTVAREPYVSGRKE